MAEFFERVYSVLREVPKGKVVTYGQIAKLLGAPNSSRAVGYALHHNPKPIEIPCHRVVNREGRLSGNFAFGGKNAQAKLLEAEGVPVKDGYVDLKKYQYQFHL